MAESNLTRDQTYDNEIRDLRLEIVELRQLLIGMKRSTDNMDSHIGFIMGAYNRYQATLEFMSDIFLTVKSRLLFGRAPRDPEINGITE